MNKQEILNKLLIKPKSIELTGGEYTKNAKAEIYTNAKSDISYLLSLAGFENDAEKASFGEDDIIVLSIGAKEPEIPELVFINDEEYYMEIGAESLLIAARNEPAMLLGLKAFIRMSEELGALPTMKIDDYPDIPFRTVHTCIFRPDDGTDKEKTSPEDIKAMIKNAAIAGYNHIIIEFWGMFPYKNEWAHWPEAYTREQVEDVVSYALDKMHIIPIPDQNLTSHAAWSRISSRQHVVLDQRPDLDYLYIPGGWCFSTEDERVKEFLKSCMDELIEVFRNPPYLHCGCDKCFGFGSGEEDRMTSADVLFAKHISFLNTYLAHKNVRMIMWGDMLYCSMDALYWKCSENTANYIPRNVLINIWTHNNPGRNWQDAAFFEDKGFETVYSPFMQEESIESMVEVCRDRGSHGMVQTTWHRPQSAVPYVILSGALQWCGKKPERALIDAHAKKWYNQSK